MLDDAVTAKQAEGGANGVKVIDIAQVLADSIGLRREPATVGAPAAAADAPDASAGAPSEGPAAPAQPLESSTTTEPGPTVDPSDRRPGSEETVVDPGSDNASD
jgi:hypothetical protein